MDLIRNKRRLALLLALAAVLAAAVLFQIGRAHV